MGTDDCQRWKPRLPGVSSTANDRELSSEGSPEAGTIVPPLPVQERGIARSDALTERLQGALNSRIIIEQARGALAQMKGTTPDHAFQLMRSNARSTHRRLVEIAQDVVGRIDLRP